MKQKLKQILQIIANITFWGWLLVTIFSVIYVICAFIYAYVNYSDIGDVDCQLCALGLLFVVWVMIFFVAFKRFTKVVFEEKFLDDLFDIIYDCIEYSVLSFLFMISFFFLLPNDLPMTIFEIFRALLIDVVLYGTITLCINKYK